MLGLGGSGGSGSTPSISIDVAGATVGDVTGGDARTGDQSTTTGDNTLTGGDQTNTQSQTARSNATGGSSTWSPRE